MKREARLHSPTGGRSGRARWQLRNAALVQHRLFWPLSLGLALVAAGLWACFASASRVHRMAVDASGHAYPEAAQDPTHRADNRHAWSAAVSSNSAQHEEALEGRPGKTLADDVSALAAEETRFIAGRPRAGPASISSRGVGRSHGHSGLRGAGGSNRREGQEPRVHPLALAGQTTLWERFADKYEEDTLAAAREGDVGVAPLKRRTPQWRVDTHHFHGPFTLAAHQLAAGDKVFYPRKAPNSTQFSYEPLATVTPEMVALMPEVDPLRSGGYYETCAVVGSAGSLNLYELGDAIDEHDAVIRINKAPTVGFEHKVGRRTTFRVVNRNSFGFYEKPTETVLQHITNSKVLSQFYMMLSRRKSDGMEHATVLPLSPDFYKFALWFSTEGTLSNGFYAVLLASQICRRTTVFGFHRHWRGSTSYHYFDEHRQSRALEETLADSQQEADRLHWFVGNASAVSYGEPCMGEACASTDACPSCAPGSTCQCGVWHPVPAPGYCYKHAASNHSRAAADLTCFHKCPDCLGGESGFCPLSSKYDALCAKKQTGDPDHAPEATEAGL